MSAINGSLHTGRQGRHVHLNNTSKRPGTREWEVTVVEDNEKKVKAPVSGCHLQWPRSPAVGATLNHFGDKSTLFMNIQPGHQLKFIHKRIKMKCTKGQNHGRPKKLPAVTMFGGTPASRWAGLMMSKEEQNGRDPGACAPLFSFLLFNLTF